MHKYLMASLLLVSVTAAHAQTAKFLYKEAGMPDVCSTITFNGSAATIQKGNETIECTAAELLRVANGNVTAKEAKFGYCGQANSPTFFEANVSSKGLFVTKEITVVAGTISAIEYKKGGPAYVLDNKGQCGI